VSDKGIALSVTLPEKVYAGSEIPLAVSVKNEGKTPVGYYRDSKYRECHVAVVDAKGNAMPLTLFGKTVLGTEPGESARVKIQLAAGKGIEVTFNLGRVFDLTVAGDYAVTVTRIFNEGTPQEFKVTISRFAFRVLEPPK